MTRSDIICWLDLETSGSDKNSDILEIGIAITDATPALTILREYQAVVMPDTWDRLYRRKLVNVVRDMHTKNGLLNEVALSEKSIRDCWPEIDDFLGKGTNLIPIAGSGVCHFDRQFIRRDLPNFDMRLTYWSYDVGVMRRMMRLAGNDVPSGVEDDKPHRALADVRWAIEEARDYLALLGSLKVPA